MDQWTRRPSKRPIEPLYYTVDRLCRLCLRVCPFRFTSLVYVSCVFCLLLIYMEPTTMSEERERERAVTRTHPRLCRNPRTVGERKRVPRTPATLQLVSETGWQHPVESTTASPQQQHK